jgi:acetolactate synthase-1/2/3 large subunit
MTKHRDSTDGGTQVVEVLKRHGVRFLYTLCGGHISPILVAAEKLGVRVVDVRHEATAVFAADATARLTGIPGVAAVTAGPGVTNTITAVKNAQLAQSPLVLLGGATATMLKGRGSLQDIDQITAMRPHVKWAFSARTVGQIIPSLQQAFEIARADTPGPVFLELPVDLLYPEAVVRQWYGLKPQDQVHGWKEWLRNRYLTRHVDQLFRDAASARPAAPRKLETPRFLPARWERVSALLQRAARPLLLVGSQALLDVPHIPELRQAIATLGIPVYLSGMARGLMGRDHPLLLRHRRKQALRQADVVILAGVPADFRLNYGRDFAPHAQIVSVNLDPHEVRKNLKAKEAVRGDCNAFLRGLAELRGNVQRHWPDWLHACRERDQEREREIDAAASQGAGAAADGTNPLALLRRLEQALPEDSILVGDGGDFVATASYVLRPRGPLSWLDPGVFGTLGAGAGFALAAQLCRPSAQVWILYGDGSVGYSLSEWDTFARHNLPILGLVGNDGGWQQIAREQVEVLGSPIGTVLAQSDYQRAAEGLGAEGILVANDEQAGPALRDAQARASAGKPVLINARCARTAFRKGSISI